MATITRAPSKTWKAVVRKQGGPTTIRTFRTRRDASDWARRTEGDMVRGVYIDHSGAERLLSGKALDRYLSEVSSTKRASTAYSKGQKSKALRNFFGPYSLAAITRDLQAETTAAPPHTPVRV